MELGSSRRRTRPGTVDDPVRDLALVAFASTLGVRSIPMVQASPFTSSIGPSSS